MGVYVLIEDQPRRTPPPSPYELTDRCFGGPFSLLQTPPFRTANPYQPVGDFLSNISKFKIIESTLREGEQFANAFFDTGE